MLSVDCTDEAQWEDYEVSNLVDCCKIMEEYGYSAKGCDRTDPLDDKDLKTKSELVYNALHEQNPTYIPFTLKKRTLTDKSGWCQHKGWSQGSNESDCFLDSVLFSLFGNDKIVGLLSSQLDDLYKETKTKEDGTKIDGSNILKKIAYCTSVYTEFLAKSRPLNKPQLKTNDIKIKIDSKEEVYEFKQAIKWCLLWNLCLYIKEYKHDVYDELVLNGLGTSIIRKTLDFDGADPNNLLHAFSFIFENLKINWNLGLGSTGLYSEEGKSSEDLIELIENIIKNTAYEENDIIAIPFFKGITITRPYRNFFAPTLGTFEATILSTNKHVTALTHCNDSWLQYDNMRSTQLDKDTIIMKLKIIEKLKNNIGINTLLFVKTKTPNARGGRKLTKKIKKKYKTKKKGRKNRFRSRSIHKTSSQTKFRRKK